MPLALIFVLPLVQMVLTSFMSRRRDQPVPAAAHPDAACTSRATGSLFTADAHRCAGSLNTVIVSAIAVVVAPRALLDWPATASPGCKFAGRGHRVLR